VNCKREIDILFFASKAKKEGLMQISEIVLETANQEKEHAEQFF
jgi:rubrerythrin